MTEQQSRPQTPGAEEPTPTVAVEPTLRTGAGIPLTTEVTVTNTSAEPRVLSVVVLGIDSAWRPAPVTTPLLAPGATLAVPLTLHPVAGTLPAQYPVAVTVQSLTADGRSSGASPGVTNTVLVVNPRAQVSMEITPSTISAWRRKRFALELRNTGGGAAKLTLKPVSTRAVRVGLEQREVEVPAGTTIRVRGHATARHPMVLGIPMRHLIRVEATGTEAKRHADGEFAQNSLLPPFLLKAITILAILSVWIGAGIVFLPRLTNVFGGASQLTTAAIQKHVTTTKGGGGKGGGSNGSGHGGGSGGSKGSGNNGGNGGKGGGKGAGGGSSSGGGHAAKAKGIQLNGTVQAADPAGVHVTLTPTSLVNEEADLGNGDVRTVGFSESMLTDVGKISPAAMLLTVAPSRKPQTRGLVTGADGSWSFAHVTAPGYYLLSFDKPGYQVTSYVIDSSSAAAAKPLPVPLTAGEGALSGTVTGPNGKPVGGATITITDGTSTLTASSDTTGNVGHWSVTGLSTPATYTVSATASGLSDEAKDVDLAAGGTSTVDLALRTGVATLSGTVTGPDSTGTLAGLPGATVTVTDGQNVDRTATTITENNLQGTYLVPGLPVPGSYTVTLSAPGYQAQVTKLTLKAGQGSAEVDATLPSSAGVVEGVVTDKNGGAGLASAGLVLSNSTNTYKTTTTSATPGQFRLNGVAPGTYTLTTELFDYVTDQLTVTVGEGGDVTIDPVLSQVVGGVLPATASITGSAIDANTSKPITTCASASDACLTATITYPKNSSVAPVRFGASEQYTLSGLLPGAYQVTVSAPGYEVAQVSVTVGLGAKVTAPTAPLYPAPHISGAILSNMSGQVPTGPVCVFAVPSGGTDVPSACPSGATAGVEYTGSTCASTVAATATSTNCYVTDASKSFKYDMTLADHGGYTVYVIPSDTDWVPAQPAPFTVAQGATVPYNPALDRYGNVVVTVKVPQGNVLVLASGVSVTVTDASGHAVTDAQGNPIGTLTTGSLGTVTVPPLIPGSYRISATSGGVTLGTTVAVVDNQTFSPQIVLTNKVVSIAGQVTSSLGTIGVDAGHTNFVGQQELLPVGQANLQFTAPQSWDAAGNAQQITIPVTTDSQGCFALLTTADATDFAANATDWNAFVQSQLPSACQSDGNFDTYTKAKDYIGQESFVGANASVQISATGYVTTTVNTALNTTTPAAFVVAANPIYLTSDGTAGGAALHIASIGTSSPNWPAATTVTIVPPFDSGMQASNLSFSFTNDGTPVVEPTIVTDPNTTPPTTQQLTPPFTSSASLSFTDRNLQATYPGESNMINPGEYQVQFSVGSGYAVQSAILNCGVSQAGCTFTYVGGPSDADGNYDGTTVVPIHQYGAIAILPVYSDGGTLTPISGATIEMDATSSESTTSAGTGLFPTYTGISAGSSHYFSISAAGYIPGSAGDPSATDALTIECTTPQNAGNLSLGSLTLNSATAVTVAEGQYTYCVALMDKAPSITGHASSILVPSSAAATTGNLAGATVTATCSDSSTCGTATYTATTDSSGSYTLQGTAGVPMQTGTYIVALTSYPTDYASDGTCSSGATSVTAGTATTNVNCAVSTITGVSVSGPTSLTSYGAGPTQTDLSARLQPITATFEVLDPANTSNAYTGATVTVKLTSSTPGVGPFTATTSITGANAGKVTFTASDGFLPGTYDYTLTGSTAVPTTGSVLSVTVPATGNGSTYKIGPVTLSTVNVTGQVTDNAGTGLPGSTVYLCDANNGTTMTNCASSIATEVANGTTGSDTGIAQSSLGTALVGTAGTNGTFSIPNVPVGDYTVWAYDASYSIGSSPVSSTNSATGQWQVLNSSPANVPTNTIALTPISHKVTIAVTPTDSSDSLAGAVVKLTDGGTTLSSSTDGTFTGPAADGSYTATFGNVVHGCWTASLDLSGLSGTHAGTGQTFDPGSATDSTCDTGNDLYLDATDTSAVGGITFQVTEAEVTPTLTQATGGYHNANGVPVNVSISGPATVTGSPFTVPTSTAAAGTERDGAPVWLGPGTWSFSGDVTDATAAFWTVPSTTVTVDSSGSATDANGHSTSKAAMTITENFGSVPVDVSVNSAGINDATVDVYPGSDTSGPLYESTVTTGTTAGAASFDLPYGSWTITAAMDGYDSSAASETIDLTSPSQYSGSGTSVDLSLTPIARNTTVTLSSDNLGDTSLTGATVTATRTITAAEEADLSATFPAASALSAQMSWSSTENGSGGSATYTQTATFQDNGDDSYSFTDLPWGDSSSDETDTGWTVNVDDLPNYDDNDSTSLDITANDATAQAVPIQMTRSTASAKVTVVNGDTGAVIKTPAVTVTLSGGSGTIPTGCTTTSGGNGTCTITGIPFDSTSTYSVTTTSLSGYTSNSPSFTVDSSTVSGGALASADAPTISLSPTRYTVTVDALDGSTAESGITITASDTDSPQYSPQCTTATDGSTADCTLQLPNGTWSLTATATGAYSGGSGGPVTVNGSDIATTQAVALTKWTDSQKVKVGGPIGTVVTAHDTTGANSDVVSSATTSAPQIVTLALAKGSWTITASQPGYTDVNASSPVSVASSSDDLSEVDLGALSPWTATLTVDLNSSSSLSNTWTVSVTAATGSHAPLSGSHPSASTAGSGPATVSGLTYGAWAVSLLDGTSTAVSCGTATMDSSSGDQVTITADDSGTTPTCTALTEP